MEIKALGYVVVGSSKLDEWAKFAGSLFGMQVGERTASSLALRMDERRQRLSVGAQLREGAFITGWQVDDKQALDSLAGRLEAAGVKVTRGTSSLAEQRFVREVFSF